MELEFMKLLLISIIIIGMVVLSYFYVINSVIQTDFRKTWWWGIPLLLSYGAVVIYIITFLIKTITNI